SPSRAEAPALVADVARSDPGPRRGGAGGAGPLLRLSRDLQRRPGGGGSRSRRPQGGARARDRRAGIREREPGLPRPDLRRAAPREATAAGSPSDRGRRRVDPQRRRGPAAQVGETVTGRSSSSRSTRASAGKSFHHAAATTMVAAPPST